MGLGQWLTLSALARWFPHWKPQLSSGLSLSTLLGWTGLLLGVWFLSGYLPWQTGGGRDVVLFLFALIVWGIAERRLIGLLLAATTAVLGTLVELAMVAAGTFYYLPEHSNLKWGFNGGVPTWLPWLYIVANVCAWRVASGLISPPAASARSN